ncbi:MAG: DUF6282 family protein [Faecalibacterium prausnitzii]
MENAMQGIIDMHIHAAPDVRARKLDDLELMEASVQRGVRAIVLKSHNVPTADRAYLVNRVAAEKYPDVKFTAFGGLCLNRPVGGLNPDAAETSLKLGAKVIWLPTNTAENHYRKNGKDPSTGVVVTRDGKAVDELQDIFALVKQYNAVLATGHIGAEECFPVVEAARAAGVEKIVITHPEFWVVGMTPEQQADIVRKYDVLLESVYAQPVNGSYKINIPDNIAAMKAIGPEHFVISTDSGQTVNPYWYESYTTYFKAVSEVFTSEQVRKMTHDNPAWLLDIDQ